MTVGETCIMFFSSCKSSNELKVIYEYGFTNSHIALIIDEPGTSAADKNIDISSFLSIFYRLNCYRKEFFFSGSFWIFFFLLVF